MLTEQQRRGLDWQKNGGMMPTIVQHVVSGEVLMMGYMNDDALHMTEETDQVTFYSRSKQRLWTKGESSGNVLNVVSLYPDCDNDTLLILVRSQYPTCHNGTSSCFHPAASDFGFLYQLEVLLRERKSADPYRSYTARLYASHTHKIAQKVGEEGLETALAAILPDREDIINEAADLVYHLIVLLQDKNLDFSQVIARLRDRHNHR